MGTPSFALPSLEAVAEHHDLAAVYTRRDKPRGRGRRVRPSAVKARALEHDVPVEQPATLRTDDAPATLASHRPDVLVVVAYGLILPPEILEGPPRGCINVHASLLPRHRGAAPVAWAILAGDRQTGVTTMLMDEGLDTGPILVQRSEPIRPRDTTPELADRLSRRGAGLLVDTLQAWEEDGLEPTPQEDAEATLAPRFDKTDGAIDWDLPAAVLDRRVRGLQPWPGTYTFVGDERLRIWAAEPDPVRPGDVEPGTVVRAEDAGVEVACGEGILRVLELQRAGGRRQRAADFLRGHPLPPGTRLGPGPAREDG